MADKNLFKSASATIQVVPTNTVNEAGGAAYQLTDKAALAQVASTGCFGNTFYVDAKDQLAKVQELANKVDPAFVAKVAVYARQKGFMKDMPAVLSGILAKKDVSLLKKVFSRTIDGGKMIRNFVQIIRSGVTGRKSLGTAPKKLINNWLNSASDETLFRASVGNDPSLSDVIKMTHPTPANDKRAALYGYLTGKEAAGEGKPLVEEKRDPKTGKTVVIHRYNPENLPDCVKNYENFKKTRTGTVPNVDFRLLTALNLTQDQWVEIAKNAPWHMARMNLNTFARHGVFNVPGMDTLIADKLSNPETISKIKVFPYQLMAAFKNTDSTGVPVVVTNALQVAMEHATSNIPEIKGKVYVFPDVSGSMSSAVTGSHGAVQSKIRCIDVAALVAASVMRRNPTAEVIPFESDIVATNRLKLNPLDSVMTNAQKLASIGGGGTNCSAPLSFLNRVNAKGDLIIYVSDNESNISKNGRGTETMREWVRFKARNPQAKMVCIDISPNTTSQTIDDESILNIGGFSDTCFEIVSAFASGGRGTQHWIDVIEALEIS